jgi:hypothetical protein
MKVVVLVDEYDGPIINHINDIPKANENRDLLRNFYKVLKEEDNFLRFVFITGVSKFAKVSIFSGLNNLSDLSMNEDFASLCGYTQSELESYFSEYLDKIVEKFKNRPQDLELEKASEVNKEQILAKTRFWYNGFRFTKDTLTVYNPFSILEFLQNEVKMGQTTAYEVLRDAQKVINEMQLTEIETAFNEAVAQLEELYEDTSDKKLRLEIRKEISKMRGLYAAQEIKHSGEIGIQGIDIKIITNKDDISKEDL